ncbi:MAG: hypothetical protein K8T91_19240 [Planctomycetes bacterium]|nr:hypothetical protein [Planctomycetota bacterium]
MERTASTHRINVENPSRLCPMPAFVDRLAEPSRFRFLTGKSYATLKNLFVSGAKFATNAGTVAQQWSACRLMCSD